MMLVGVEGEVPYVIDAAGRTLFGKVQDADGEWVDAVVLLGWCALQVSHQLPSSLFPPELRCRPPPSPPPVSSSVWAIGKLFESLKDTEGADKKALLEVLLARDPVKRDIALSSLAAAVTMPPPYLSLRPPPSSFRFFLPLPNHDPVGVVDLENCQEDLMGICLSSFQPLRTVELIVDEDTDLSQKLQSQISSSSVSPLSSGKCAVVLRGRVVPAQVVALAEWLLGFQSHGRGVMIFVSNCSLSSHLGSNAGVNYVKIDGAAPICDREISRIIEIGLDLDQTSVSKITRAVIGRLCGVKTLNQVFKLIRSDAFMNSVEGGHGSKLSFSMDAFLAIDPAPLAPAEVAVGKELRDLLGWTPVPQSLVHKLAEVLYAADGSSVVETLMSSSRIWPITNSSDPLLQSAKAEGQPYLDARVQNFVQTCPAAHGSGFLKLFVSAFTETVSCHRALFELYDDVNHGLSLAEDLPRHLSKVMRPLVEINPKLVYPLLCLCEWTADLGQGEAVFVQAISKVPELSQFVEVSRIVASALNGRHRDAVSLSKALCRTRGINSEMTSDSAWDVVFDSASGKSPIDTTRAVDHGVEVTLNQMLLSAMHVANVPIIVSSIHACLNGSASSILLGSFGAICSEFEKSTAERRSAANIERVIHKLLLMPSFDPMSRALLLSTITPNSLGDFSPFDSIVSAAAAGLGPIEKIALSLGADAEAISKMNTGWASYFRLEAAVLLLHGSPSIPHLLSLLRHWTSVAEKFHDKSSTSAFRIMASIDDGVSGGLEPLDDDIVMCGCLAGIVDVGLCALSQASRPLAFRLKIATRMCRLTHILPPLIATLAKYWMALSTALLLLEARDSITDGHVEPKLLDDTINYVTQLAIAVGLQSAAALLPPLTDVSRPPVLPAARDAARMSLTLRCILLTLAVLLSFVDEAMFVPCGGLLLHAVGVVAHFLRSPMAHDILDKASSKLHSAGWAFLGLLVKRHIAEFEFDHFTHAVSSTTQCVWDGFCNFGWRTMLLDISVSKRLWPFCTHSLWPTAHTPVCTHMSKSVLSSPAVELTTDNPLAAYNALRGLLQSSVAMAFAKPITAPPTGCGGSFSHFRLTMAVLNDRSRDCLGHVASACKHLFCYLNVERVAAIVFGLDDEVDPILGCVIAPASRGAGCAIDWCYEKLSTTNKISQNIIEGAITSEGVAVWRDASQVSVVMRRKSMMRAGNIISQTGFGNCPYVKACGLRSVAVIPVTDDDTVSMFLVLENFSLPGQFGSDFPDLSGNDEVVVKGFAECSSPIPSALRFFAELVTNALSSLPNRGDSVGGDPAGVPGLKNPASRRVSALDPRSLQKPRKVSLKGFLRKRGQRVKNWKRRYFTLVGSQLTYYDDESCADHKDRIIIDRTTQFAVLSPQMDNFSALKAPSPYVMRLDTGSRVLFICAESQAALDKWAEGFTTTINNAIDASLGTGQHEISSPDLPSMQIEQCIGEGGFGQVFKAAWMGLTVAVKRLSADLTANNIRLFKSEATLMSKMRHPNILMYLGSSLNPPDMFIVTEWMPRGSLYKILQDPTVDLSLRRRVMMGLDAAQAMLYLHSADPPIIHRDLKSENLLVDENWNVKVADFGLTRESTTRASLFVPTSGGSTMMTGNVGSIRYCAPEILTQSSVAGYNEKADVYSFGMILWELTSRKRPFFHLPARYEDIFEAIRSGVRPTIDDRVPPALGALIQDCWHPKPNRRPNFSEICARLKAMSHEI